MEPSDPRRASDPLARILEAGLVLILFAAPLPMGAVTPAGRLALEVAAGVLGLAWVVRALRWPTHLPPIATQVGLMGLLLLGLTQLVPLGEGLLPFVSPRSVEIRAELRPSGETLDAERRLLGSEPAALDPPAVVSLTPDAGASALRTGTALVLLLLVSCTVVRSRGAGRLCVALTLSAAFQAVYGSLEHLSGHQHIFFYAKQYYLEEATGTFVNRNHFAGFLAAALPCGLALLFSMHPDRASARGLRQRVLSLFGSDQGVRAVMLGLLLALGAAGLMLSFSRAGIAFGTMALVLVVLASGRRRIRKRLAIAVLLVAVAAVPIAQMGWERLGERYAGTSDSLSRTGGRATVWSDTLRLAADFPAAGAGFGTFFAVYPLYRSPTVRSFYHHAHNDPVQLLAEGGLVGGLLFLLALAPIGRRMIEAFAGRGGILAVGAAAGLSAMFLHALVDFNFHIPSNAAVGAILSGVLLGLPWNDRT